MKEGIIVMERLSYKDLSALYENVKKELAKVNELLKPHLHKPLSEVRKPEIDLLTRRFFLNAVKMEISDIILHHVETINLPEELWKQS